MAITAWVCWLVTAALGLTVLRAGGKARRAAATPAPAAVLAPAATQAAAATTAPAAALAPAASVPVRTGAVPLTADGRPPPVPHVRVSAPAGDHPLLEFAHPMLAISGLACWTMFTFVHYRPMAWISLAIMVAAITLGLGWQARTLRAGRAAVRTAWRFPKKLVALHAAAASSGVAVAVLSALAASHG